MYYLLEDNRIIDTNEVLNSGIQIKIKVSGDSKVLYLIGWFGERFFGTIKKQSENVYDLIDWEKDIVAMDTFGEFLIFNCKTTRSDFFDGFYRFRWIKAIYKPDEKGNYIKAWEKKDESK